MDIRLQDIWQLFPKSHQVFLKVKPAHSRDTYYARDVSGAWERCPYYHRLAKVISVYAVTKESVEITVEETLPEGR